MNARSDKPSASCSPSILVIGAGSIGERHLRCFLRTSRCKVGVCETNNERLKYITDLYPVSQSYTRLDDALNDTWDAAVVATPAPSHVPLALRLARLGIHLLIEKPLSLNEEGLPELAEVSSAKHLQVNVGYVCRAHPALTAMRQAIQAGRFGRPLEVVATVGQYFPHYRPAYRQTYYVDHATGGGAIQDGLTHIFNAAEWLVGPIDRIAVDAAHLKLAGVTVEDTVHALAHHGTVLASYVYNQHQAPNEFLVTVIGAEGTARFEMLKNRWMWMKEVDSPWNIEGCELRERDDLFQRQATQYLDQLEQQSEPLCSLHEAWQTMRVNIAALQSAHAEGQWHAISSTEVLNHIEQ